MIDYKVITGVINACRYIELRDDKYIFQYGCSIDPPEYWRDCYKKEMPIEKRCLYHAIQYIQSLESKLHKINLVATELDENGVLDLTEIIELSEIN